LRAMRVGLARPLHCACASPSRTVRASCMSGSD
jgi:hypothetical protein